MTCWSTTLLSYIPKYTHSRLVLGAALSAHFQFAIVDLTTMNTIKARLWRNTGLYCFSILLHMSRLMLASASPHRQHLPAHPAGLLWCVVFLTRSRSWTQHLRSTKLRKLPSSSREETCCSLLSVFPYFFVSFFDTSSPSAPCVCAQCGTESKSITCEQWLWITENHASVHYMYKYFLCSTFDKTNKPRY